MRKHVFLSALAALALVACGGGDKAFVGGSGATGGGGGATAATPASLVVNSNAASIPADGSVTADITALVRDSSNVVIAGVPVTFSATSGALNIGSEPTSTDGIARVGLSTGGDSTPRNVTVTVHAGTFTATINVAVGAAPSSNAVVSLTMMSSASTIPSDGSSPATVIAIARDANNLLMSGVPISFTASSGGLQVTKGVTGSDGQAIATLSTAGDATTRNITVTASTGGLTANTVVAVAATSSTTTVSMGNGSGVSFTPNVLAVAVPSLSAGGSTSVTVSVVRQDNSLYTQPVSLTFSSPCFAAGKALIQPSATATTATGQATVTYVAQGCSGTDVITATAIVGSQSLSASKTVTVAPPTVGSIQFVSATPTNIALKGTGATGHPETSTVVFQVRDQTNGPVAGAVVNFALSTTVGGITLTSLSATSDSQGNVQTIVNAGTVATPVRVSATVASSSIGTQSSQLTISTGIPTAGSFSLALACSNIEGWDYDGTTTTVTARLADRFSNPVPDGTAVSFQAEGGAILPQCTTTTNSNEGGLCSVDVRSSNPRPSDGRISLLAKAIGEESFIDADGNGAFTVGDTFNRPPPFGSASPVHDLGEPFLDMNENGVYDLGEPFYDFNNDSVRNGPDGLFNGALCQDVARCSSNPLKQTAGIGANAVLVISGSTPIVTLNDGSPNGAPFAGQTFAMTQNSARTFNLWIRDVNGNAMPGNTVITASSSGAGLSVSQPSSATLACSAVPAGSKVSGVTLHSFTVTSGTTTGLGTFVITVKTPKNNTTTFVVNVNVT